MYPSISTLHACKNAATISIKLVYLSPFVSEPMLKGYEMFKPRGRFGCYDKSL